MSGRSTPVLRRCIDMVRIKVDDAEQLPDLAASLLARVDAVVSKTDDNELEVSLLGSRATEAELAEIAARLRAWGGPARILEPLPAEDESD